MVFEATIEVEVELDIPLFNTLEVVLVLVAAATAVILFLLALILFPSVTTIKGVGGYPNVCKSFVANSYSFLTSISIVLLQDSSLNEDAKDFLDDMESVSETKSVGVRLLGIIQAINLLLVGKLDVVSDFVAIGKAFF